MGIVDINHFFCYSLSAKDGHSASQREKVAITEDKQNIILAQWKQRLLNDPNASFFYLGTCHRIECYGFGIAPNELKQMWSIHSERAALDEAKYYCGLDAYEHLVRVSASLESEVLGETQIAGQLKDALVHAKEMGTLRGALDRLSQQALRAAKRVRRETSLGEGTVSVAHIAVDGIRDFFDNFESKKALVVGAGAMAMQALERLKKMGVERITWMNRSLEKIQHHPLATHCQIAPLEDLHRLCSEQAIIVLATASSEVLLKRCELEKTLAQSKLERRKKQSAPLKVVLDLGLPRNVDPEIHEFYNFYVRNVDEFSNRVEQNKSIRSTQMLKAEQIVDEEVQLFLKLWNNWSRSAPVSELYRVLEGFRVRELEHLGLDNSPEIEYVTRGLFARLLHRLLEEVEDAEDPLATEVLDTLARAWRQDQEWPREKLEKQQRVQKDLNRKTVQPLDQKPQA